MPEFVIQLRCLLGAAVRRIYPGLYAALCGEHPNLRPWHFQWLAGRMLYGPLRETLGQLEGDVVDVGCGTKPYEAWVPGARRYFGIDVADGPHVDAVIVPGERWPIDENSFDVAICTQVLEHVADLEHTVRELHRVVRPGGTLIVAVPFAYNEHGTPHDYRRFSRHGAAQLLEGHAEIKRVIPQGAVGSLIGIALLNWLEVVAPRSGPLALLRLATLPVWLAFTVAVNGCGAALDRVDRTGLFYTNVLVVARQHGA